LLRVAPSVGNLTSGHWTQNEHFGMVPLEAMAAQRPVIACASGGPMESILDGVTGYLCSPTPSAFADAAALFLQNPAGASKLKTLQPTIYADAPLLIIA